jgi:P27 family predicted phage terminase small subunit
VKRGRKPKPDALKIAQGNPGRRAIAPSTAAPAPADAAAKAAGMVAPAELTDVKAIAIWARTTWRLAGLNFIQPTDADAFARYCKYLSLWYQLAEQIDVDNLVVTTKSDAVEMDRLDRRFQAMLLLDKRLEATEDRFGLNPQARHQLLRDKVGGGARQPSGQLPGIEKPATETKDKPAPTPAPPSSTSSIGALRRTDLN